MIISKNLPAAPDELTPLRNEIIAALALGTARTDATGADRQRVLACVDPEKLRAYQRFLSHYNAYIIGIAVDSLRESGDTNVDAMVLEQVKAVHMLYMAAMEEMWDEVIKQLPVLRSHVVVRAADAPLFAEAIRRQHCTLESVLELVDEMKQIAPSLIDGAL